MKKIHFLGTILGVATLLLPTFTFAASPLDGLIKIPVLSLNIMTCKVQGKVMRTSNVSNQITYTVSYGSNFSKANVPFTVYGTVDHVTTNLTVYQMKGTLKFAAGEGNLNVSGKEENVFNFPIQGNPGVTVNATVDGVHCLPAYFKTIQPVVLINVPQASIVPVLVADPSTSATPPVMNNGASGSASSTPAASPSNAGGVVTTNNAGVQATRDNLSGQAEPSNQAVAADVNGGTTVVVTENALGQENQPAVVAAQEFRSDWTVKDTVEVGLLGGIFIALVAYIIMKYKAMV